MKCGFWAEEDCFLRALAVLALFAFGSTAFWATPPSQAKDTKPTWWAIGVALIDLGTKF